MKRTVSIADLERALEAGTCADRILRVLADGQWWLSADIVANADISPATFRTTVAAMVHSGRLEGRRVSVNGKKYSCYRLLPEKPFTSGSR